MALSFSINVSAQTFNCDGAGSCSGTNFCNEGEACNIQCIGDQSCMDATFYCPSDQYCSFTANGSSAMEDVYIFGGDRGKLKLDLTGAAVFAYGRVYCPANGVCTVKVNENSYYGMQHSYVYAQNSLFLGVETVNDGGLATQISIVLIP